MDEINAMGGIRIGDTCVKFKYHHEDDMGTAAGAVAAAEKLLYDFKAQAIVAVGSIVAVQVWQPRTEKEKVILFAQTSPLYKYIGEENAYSFMLHDITESFDLTLLNWVSKNRPDIKKVVGIRMNTVAVEDESGVAKAAAFPEYGIEYTRTYLHEQTTYDFYPVLTSALKDNPDAIICDYYPFANLAKQARELGFKGTFINIGAIPDYAFGSFSPAELEGTISMNPSPESPLVPQYYKDYLEAYKERKGTYPYSYTTFASYLVPYYVAAAIKAAGSTDSDRLKEVMETQTLTLEFPNGETLDVKMGGANLFGVNHVSTPQHYISVVRNGKPEVVEVVTPQMTLQDEGIFMEYLQGIPREEIEISPTTSQPSVARELTIESSIGEILDNPDGEAILRECLGDEIVDNPQMSMAFGMNLPTIAPMSGGVITDEMVACVDEALQALAAGGTTSQPPAQRVTIDSPIGEILDNPDGEAILRECLGDESVDNPQMSMAFGMNLPTIAPMSGGVITDEMLACVEEGLQSLAP